VALAGIIPPLTTPFEDSRIAPVRLRENIARYETAGVAGYLLFGSSGEAVLLDEVEKIALLGAARSAIPSTRSLIAGVGLESTAATLRLAQIAADQGADLLLVLTPHYFAGRMNAQALEAHYHRVADESPLPLLLYDVPKFTHLQISADSVVTLSRHEKIVGIKDSAGDLDRLLDLSQRTADDFSVICGSHAVIARALAGGIRAGILAAADPFPGPYVELYGLVRDDRLPEAESLQERLSEASGLAVATFGVPGIKAAMDLCGFYGGAPRLPLLSLGDAEAARLRDAVERVTEMLPGKNQ
jgi:4-hydroxy-2-oxoglutarate aldolase